MLLSEQKAELPYPCALEVYDSYTRDQLFAALGYAKPASIREGVKYLDPANSDTVTRPTDVFLVTLNKSQKEFSDTTLYEDYSIDRHLFHWQSQSTTTPESKTGQRYLSQRETGGIVLLFVRSAKQDACRNAMPTPSLAPQRSSPTKAPSPSASSIASIIPFPRNISQRLIAAACCDKKGYGAFSLP